MHNVLNETACEALVTDVGWTSPSLLVSLAVLAVIDVLVIVGNCLVIIAVFYSSKLRSVTNLFIVSLAVADLMVGVLVLPFSATWQIYEVWIFGDVWCNIWLAVDVWMCTASILNLCAISLDRYLAVTRPVAYPSLMSSSRAKLLIAGLWVLSFVICFPPLVGWKDDEVPQIEVHVNDTQNVTTTVLNPPCPWTCELTNEVGYVVYSALGSFYVPMLVMLFFYWRIYKAAVRTTRAINQGFRTTKGTPGGIDNQADGKRLTLRIHRGRGSVMHHHSSPHSNGSASASTTVSTCGTAVSSPSPRVPRGDRVKINISYADENQPMSSGSSVLNSSHSQLSSQALYTVHYTPSNENKDSRENRENHLKVLDQRRPAYRSNSCGSSIEREMSPSPDQENMKPKMISKKMGKRNIKAQVKRFRMETKAAKTLGIIVGGFIVCWLPFFTIYLVRAFCEKCINRLIFSILFWLGYCNSAINPLIYALFSKDFRFAFKKIICKCFCAKTRFKNSRRGSDGSQMQGGGGGRHYRSASYNTSHHVGDDSDPGADASDSR